MKGSFAVYRSSAGSGKTFTLVKEFLKIVLKEPSQYSRILAITFTNKAAAEMKERILKNLRELSYPEKFAGEAAVRFMLPQLVEETGLSQTDLSENARIVLKHILHDYSSFAIGTIDSFMHRIVRTFAHDMHLALNFNVQLEKTPLIENAVVNLLDSLEQGSSLTHFLIEFAQSKADDDKNWDIEFDLKNFAEILFYEESADALPLLQNLTLETFQEAEQNLTQIIRTFELDVKRTALQAITILKNKELNAEDFYQGKNGIYTWFQKLSVSVFDSFYGNSYVAKTITEDKWTAAKASGSVIEKIESVKNDLKRIYGELENIREERFQTYKIAVLFRKNIHTLAVLNEIRHQMQLYATDENLVHISEFNRHIARIVRNEPVPFIYERLGEKYHHFLLDEFQDTSVMQWQNLLPLIENSLSYNRFNMIVGDGKQSIYRFRNGEVEQLVALPKIFQNNNDPILNEREAMLERNYRPEVLSENFRSRCEVVAFNNSFFGFMQQQLSEKLQAIYDNQEQKLNSANTGGLVHLEFLPDKRSDESFAELNCKRTLELIYALDADGYQRGEIAILCRGNSEASVLAEYLTQNRVQVVSSESLLLNGSPLVRFLISLLTAISNPDNPIAKAEIIHFIHCNLAEAQTSVSLEDYSRLKDLLDQPLDLMMKQLGYDFSIQKLSCQNLYDLTEMLLRIFAISKDGNPYLLFFSDAVLEYISKENGGIAGFLKWWESEVKSRSVVLPDAIGSVKIMTIHKSKGLQFPVVIYPFVKGGSSRLTKDKVWVSSKEMIPDVPVSLLDISSKATEGTPFYGLYEAEAAKSFLDIVNVVYVAFTRPVERLYVLISEPPQKAKSPTIPVLIRDYLVSQNLWNETQSVYTFGSPLAKTTIAIPEEKSTEEVKPYMPCDWHQVIRISGNRPPVWDENRTDYNRYWGSLLHNILAEIKVAHDLNRAIERFRSMINLPESDLNQAREVLHKFLNSDDIQPFFVPEAKIFCEKDIMLSDGRIIRPDRVVIYPDQVAILDYKTGKEETTHEEQIRMYAHALEQMGYKNIHLYLLYLGEEIRLKEVC
jgi:ATP-dependent exoDNAse (exonuclease V) beta subunit